jgi:psp operon transcriptional activator
MAFELEVEEEIVFSSEARLALESYPWRGNVRELKNVVERAVYKAENGRITEIEFDPFISPYDTIAEMQGVEDDTREETAGPLADGGFKEEVASFEVRMLQQALAASRFNQRKTARNLGLSYDQLRGLLRKYRDRLEGAQ